jgi:hypothetical protein
MPAVSDTNRIYRLEGVPTVPLTASSFVRAAQMGANIGRLVDSKPASRLLKGLRSLISGLETNYGQERLHAFVRALDAVVKLPPRTGYNEFAARCGTFAGRTEPVQNILRELYRLRSAAEHVNDFRSVFADLIEPECESLALQRALQAEVLASTVFIRILSSDNMTEHFAKDAWLDEFWKKTAADLDAFWDGVVDLERLPKFPMKLT